VARSQPWSGKKKDDFGACDGDRQIPLEQARCEEIPAAMF
jgi:hypothetical protein